MPQDENPSRFDGIRRLVQRMKGGAQRSKPGDSGLPTEADIEAAADVARANLAAMQQGGKGIETPQNSPRVEIPAFLKRVSPPILRENPTNLDVPKSVWVEALHVFSSKDAMVNYIYLKQETGIDESLARRTVEFLQDKGFINPLRQPGLKTLVSAENINKIMGQMDVQRNEESLLKSFENDQDALQRITTMGKEGFAQSYANAYRSSEAYSYFSTDYIRQMLERTFDLMVARNMLVTDAEVVEEQTPSDQPAADTTPKAIGASARTSPITPQTPENAHEGFPVLPRLENYILPAPVSTSPNTAGGLPKSNDPITDAYRTMNQGFGKPGTENESKSQIALSKLDPYFNFSTNGSGSVQIVDKQSTDTAINLVKSENDISAKFSGPAEKYDARAAIALARGIMEAERRMDGEFIVDLTGTQEQRALTQAAFEILRVDYPDNSFTFGEGKLEDAQLSKVRTDIQQANDSLVASSADQPDPAEVAARQQKIDALTAKIVEIESPLRDEEFTSQLGALDDGLASATSDLDKLEAQLEIIDQDDTEALQKTLGEYTRLQTVLNNANDGFAKDITPALATYDQSISDLVSSTPDMKTLVSPQYIQEVQTHADRVNQHWNDRVSGLTEAINEKIKSIGATIEQGEYAALEKTYTEARKALDDSGALQKAADNLLGLQNILGSVAKEEILLESLKAGGNLTSNSLNTSKKTLTDLREKLTTLVEADQQDVTPHMNAYNDTVNEIAARNDELSERLIDTIGEDEFFAHKQPNVQWNAAKEGLAERIDEGLAKIAVEETKITVQNALDSAIGAQETILRKHLNNNFRAKAVNGVMTDVGEGAKFEYKEISADEAIENCMDAVSEKASNATKTPITSVEDDNAAHAALRLHFLSEFKEKGMTHTGGDIPDCEDKMIALADQKIQGIQDGAGLSKAEIWETLQASRQRQVAARKQTRAPATA